MKKDISKTILLFLIVICLFTFKNIQAEAKCTTQEKNELIQLAYNIKIDYELGDYRSRIDKTRFYVITFSNVPEELYTEYNSMKYYYDTNPNNKGVITFDNVFSPKYTVSFKVYASSKTSCNNTYIATRMVTLPAYNVYSELEECDEYPNFKLCDKNYSKDITDKQFMQEFEQYKNEMKTKQKTSKENRKKPSLLNTIVGICTNNLLISISVSIIIIFIGVVLIIRYRKKQIKIKI